MADLIGEQNLSPEAIEKLEIFNTALLKSIKVACNGDRGWASQTILKELRDFVECVMFLIAFQGKESQRKYDYQNICIAKAKVREQGKLSFIRRFHDFLQISVSHYTPDENASERLMLKYYDCLIDIRSYLDHEFGIKILQYLEEFPLNTDSATLEYQTEIASRIDCVNGIAGKQRNERYYILKEIPFFVNSKKYYEITFASVNEQASKFSRHIAFSNRYIPDFYAVKLSFISSEITLFNQKLPILIISDWITSIRPCELSNFVRIFNIEHNITSSSKGYLRLMEKLTELQLPFSDIVFHPVYAEIKQALAKYANICTFFKALDKAAEIIKLQKSGANVLSYLLYGLRNKVIKNQHHYEINQNLSKLKLKNCCIPFDTMPYCSSLIEHNPSVYDLLSCICPVNREHEFLARFIRNNAETNGIIYTDIHELPEGVQANLKNHIHRYNALLWHGHCGRQLKQNGKFIFIAELQDDVTHIIERLHQLSVSGISDYSNWVKDWLKGNPGMIDCPEKKSYIENMFKDSRVAFIYGAAGTGKTTLIKHISALFSGNQKIFLAQTNPAVQNLNRKITAKNSSFYTIAKVLSSRNHLSCGLLFIDECSTVSNKDMRKVLEKVSFDLLILVGDTYQIEAINFGNWFNLSRNFIKNFICELKQPYRSDNEDLLKLWEKVRQMTDDINEHLQKKGYSSDLDESIFNHSSDDEIILCLNYDGVYGINNLNRFLQQNNINPAIYWQDSEYKIGDPVLFNETKRLGDCIYNNMKGRIVGIELLSNNTQIQFDVELEVPLNPLTDNQNNFTVVNSINGHSVIRFTIDQATDSDQDNDSDRSVIPFQIAYAVSIHKAQGLEYKSVKVVIASEVGEQITHNIFYTAITRAREKLKIYWSPECEKEILSKMEIKDCRRDFFLLRQQARLKNL